MKSILSKFMNAISGKKELSIPHAMREADVHPSLIKQMAPGATGSISEPPCSEPYKHTVQNSFGNDRIIEWC